MTRQEQERKAFLDAIAAEPESLDLRLIYADWLIEKGFDEEAESLRTWNDQKARAEQWLLAFAKDYSFFDGYYGVLQAGHEQYLHANRGDSAMDDLRADNDLLEQFWNCWSLVTGHPIPYDRYYDDSCGYPRSFTCGC